MAFLLGCVLMLVTLLLQTAGVTVLIERLRRIVPRAVRYSGPFHAAMLVFQTTIALIILHGLTILLWAGCYRWLCFESWAPALYFSGSTYPTVGYGDVLLPPRWRILGTMESIFGVLMCGLSVSLMFALIHALVTQDEARTRSVSSGQ